MTKNNHFEKSLNVENCERGDLLGFLKIQFVAKYQKNEEGPFGDIKKLSKKGKMIILNSLIVTKNVEGRFGLFQHPFSCKILKKLKRGLFGDKQNFEKKSHSAEKN